MLEVGNGGMSAVEYQTHISLWALLAAPLLAGNDLTTMTPETIALLTNREVIAIDQDPAGNQGSRVWAKGANEVWAKKLADGSQAVGFFNRSDEMADAHISRSSWSSDLGFVASVTAQECMVREGARNAARKDQSRGTAAWRGSSQGQTSLVATRLAPGAVRARQGK